MKEYSLKIVGHSADLKTVPTGSKDTGIFFPQELLDFLGFNENYSFTIYKEDCVRAMSSIISSLPLYSNKGGVKIEHTDAYDECVSLFSMINSYFGNEKTATYSGFSLSKTTGDRYYLYGLEQRGFSIRKLLIANYSVLIFQKNDNGDVTLRFETNIARENNQTSVQEQEPTFFDYSQEPLQQIFYGAPGTGKSNAIKNSTEQAEKEGRVFRTTFHPDSDYSTFVGCYKPGMKSSDRIYSAEELAVKLKEIKNSGVTYPCHKFAAKYWRSLKDLSADTIKQILIACGFTETMNVEISKGVAIGQEYLNKDEDGKIIYTFTPQAFTNAYVKAWNTEEDVYLIIEEINRGNCAQIFGDLFQLLDRKDGVSEYPVDADSDLANYISKELAGSIRDDFPDGVKEGKKTCTSFKSLHLGNNEHQRPVVVPYRQCL